ncbi:MAG: thioredoxin family protein [Hyphomicrobiaceae bacterium]
MLNLNRRRVLAFAAVFAVPAVAVAQPASAVELVMFEEPDCPWCKRWRQDIGGAYPKSKEGQRAPIRHVMLHAQARSGVTLASPVIYSPTFVLVRGGREVGRIQGYPGPDFFWSMLAELLHLLDRPPAPKT